MTPISVLCEWKMLRDRESRTVLGCLNRSVMCMVEGPIFAC